ncbi:MAG: hypothetical protein B6D37_11670 [Sphingobacteriales bacterium UTBCD1]|jgi:hypothetical protein|nr:MAG: hypothetical protein B6D37_11670 [Sphingobacteriales bacterium UTBCD1]
MNRQPGQIFYHGLQTTKIPVSKTCLKLQPLLNYCLPFKLIHTRTAGDLHKGIKKTTGEIKERDHLFFKSTTVYTKFFIEAFTEKNRIERYSKRQKKMPEWVQVFCLQAKPFQLR